MVRLKAPLMSLRAQKQLGKTLIYKMKNNRAFATGYNKPGGKNPFSASASQQEKRDFYRSAFQEWQDKTAGEKAYWNDLAKERGLNMSGWNLYYKTAFNAPVDTLGYSDFGDRIYGYYKYGEQPLS